MLEIAVLWLVNRERELLLAKRSLTKAFHPGEWGPTVTGTAELGETPEETLLREVEEELGLVVEKNIREKFPQILCVDIRDKSDLCYNHSIISLHI